MNRLITTWLRLLVLGVIGLASLFGGVGCGDSEPEKTEPPLEQEMLDKLDSDDPEKFLEGVDEARDKYGKKT